MAKNEWITKTLVFSFDGSGNEPSDAEHFTEDESISNVLKLHILMGGGIDTDNSQTRTPKNEQQITYYYNGIGTREDGQQIPLVGWLFSKIQRFVNMTFAPKWGDAARILREARKDFEECYKDNDRIVVFGFSRGAALARKFVSLILTENVNCTVSFLGVFDTVAAMNGIHRKGEKLSSDVVFENGTLNKRVKRAVHIVSLDEDRVPFAPTLINKDVKKPNRILEVWFPGVHGDIGGGYWFDGLSDRALQFMIKQCKNTLNQDVNIEEGDQAGIRRMLKQQGKALLGLTVDDIAINPMAHGVLHTHSGWMAEAGSQEPRMVRVNVNDRPSEDKDDLPILHQCVKDRFDEVVGYRPPTLRGLRFRLLLDNDKFSDPIEGISGLREYKILKATKAAK